MRHVPAGTTRNRRCPKRDGVECCDPSLVLRPPNFVSYSKVDPNCPIDQHAESLALHMDGVMEPCKCTTKKPPKSEVSNEAWTASQLSQSFKMRLSGSVLWKDSLFTIAIFVSRCSVWALLLCKRCFFATVSGRACMCDNCRFGIAYARTPMNKSRNVANQVMVKDSKLMIERAARSAKVDAQFADGGRYLRKLRIKHLTTQQPLRL